MIPRGAPGRSWRSLGVVLVRLGPFWEAPGAELARKSASGALRERFWEAFLMICRCFLEVFRMFIYMPFLIDFQLAFSRKLSSILLFFDSARKWPTSDFCNTLRVKTNISQGARLRRRSGEGEEELQETT